MITRSRETRRCGVERKDGLKNIVLHTKVEAVRGQQVPYDLVTLDNG